MKREKERERERDHKNIREGKCTFLRSERNRSTRLCNHTSFSRLAENTGNVSRGDVVTLCWFSRTFQPLLRIRSLLFSHPDSSHICTQSLMTIYTFIKIHNTAEN
jgi:hypothetical protein